MKNTAIAILDINNSIVDERKGTWCKETWDVINKDIEMGYEFDEWGLDDACGVHWKMYACDGAGALVWDADATTCKQAKTEYLKMVRAKY